MKSFMQAIAPFFMDRILIPRPAGESVAGRATIVVSQLLKSGLPAVAFGSSAELVPPPSFAIYKSCRGETCVFVLPLLYLFRVVA